MTQTTLYDLFELLDIVVLKQSHTGGYHSLGAVPAWFDHLFPGALAPEKTVNPGEWSPFLENFLIDAEGFWGKNEKGRWFSGPWIESDPVGKEFSLEASALCLKTAKILTIEHIKAAYDEQKGLLQRARENLLSNEYLEQEVRKRTLEIRNREEEVARRLVSAAEFRDYETGAHIRRMALYAVVMAKKLGWGTEATDNIRIAATMHDIGKIGIPDNVLLKPGSLTHDEFQIIREHPVIGGKMLAGSKAPMIRMAHDIALYHHEKWDGSGYPEGRSKEEIPLSARMVAITDVYDALIHKRVYKPAFSEARTLEIMTENRGRHFDPFLFDHFLGAIKEFREIARIED